MKAVFLFFGAALCSLQLLAQDVPLIKVGDKELGVSKLYVDVAVVGNRMTTTYDMYFYNPSSQLLEGELSFPLDEKQAVSRFALEVNGALREAVAVEKEQGRVAFEAVVRRKVDPALLEKGTGNNYRARIYPIPAKGYKRVLLAYEEELQISNKDHLIKVPLSFKRKLEDFSFSVSVAGQSDAPRIQSGAKMRTKFDKERGNYVLNFEAKQFKPSQEFLAKVPLDDSFVVSNYEEYTYAYRPITANQIERAKPKKIKLLWDVSYSMIERDLEKEIDFLEAYFDVHSQLDVRVSTFSNEIIKTQDFTITKGNWSAIRSMLEASVYDGATSFHNLFDTAEVFDELLVFSDGMNTLSDAPTRISTPVFVVNSIKKANHQVNKNFTESSEGGYINLSSLSTKDALAKIRYQSLQFLGTSKVRSGVDSYPKKGAVVFNDFSWAAKGLNPGEEVELLFGYGNVVTQKEMLTIPQSNDDPQVARIWAQKKVMHLQSFGDSKKGDLIELAKSFNLVTNFTSLIVLETLADYRRFAVTPPKGMFDQKELAREEVAVTTRGIRDNDKRNKESENESVARSEEIVTTELQAGVVASLSGTVTDGSGLPLMGVNVYVDGGNSGAQTNFDGEFSIEAPAGSNLVFSYVGFATLETTVRGNGSINITMQEDAQTLGEVLITGYSGIPVEQKRIGYSVSTLSAGDLNDKPESDAVRSMTGKVAGVQITGSSGATGSSTNFVIRSKSSINGNNQPLFIVDGVPFNANTNAQGGLSGGGAVTSSRFLDLDPNMIQNVQVLKGLSAAVLYGQEGRNGVVIITTKNNTASGLGSSNYYINAEAEREEQAKKRRALMKEKTIKELGFTTTYLEELQNAIGVEDMYMLYLGQRELYSGHPSYFIDVYDFFRNANAAFADRILSNVIEMDTDNYELLRVYAYKLEEKRDFKTAAFIYRQVLKLRSEDPQSYRDLALALAEIGEQDEALSLLMKIAGTDSHGDFGFRNHEEMKPIVANEIANLIQTKNLSSLPNGLSKELFKKVELDMRVVIDWNHNDTDIDLHIVDPNLETCFYGNDSTKMGGKLSEDMTEGFGPEEFTLEKAGLGSYYVKIDYFGDNYQKVENPTFMKVNIYENYGTKEQTRRTKVMRLSKNSDEKLVERIAML